jgi:hypothetical protein
MKISIKEDSDWNKLTAQGLETVVDPLVFRCGELFLKGAKTADADKIWELLNLNLHAVGMFFDALILKEKLPVFNYADTFDSQLNFDQRVLTQINDYDEVLYDVDVGWQAYTNVKNAALVEAEKVFNGELKIPAEMFEQIFRELSAAEYKWTLGLDGLNAPLASYQEKQLADYIVGGLIFGGYAQQMEGEHLLQPKRSRLFLAISMQSPSAKYEVESELFDELKNRANTPTEDLPWMPTFFPYLLEKAETPGELLKEVVKLRQSSEVADYRQWLGEVTTDWKKNGKISIEKRKDVKAITEGVDRRLGIIPSSPKFEIKLTMALAIPGELNVTPVAERLWGWILSSLPGKSYRKLLTRAIVADHEYVKLENRIKTVWQAG